MQKNSLRILEVVADGAPGGGTTAVLGLCEDLARSAAFTVGMVTQQDSYAINNGAKLGIDTFGIDFFASRFDPRICWKMTRIVAAWQPDLIHLHAARAANVFSLPPLCWSSVPLVYTVHGFHFLKKREPLRTLLAGAEKRIAKRVDEVVFVSQRDHETAVQQGILKKLYDHARVLYNGIEPHDLDAIPQADAQYDLVFASRMHRQKNPFFMIEVMAALRDSGTRLLLVGGGELEQDVRRYAQKLGVEQAITFTGTLSRNETLTAIRSGKIFVLPSLWEGMPIVLMEALHYGIPIVASKIPGNDEIIQQGITGELIEEFDAARYAAVLRALLADPARRARMGAAGKADAQQRFLRSVSTASHVELYRSLYEKTQH